MASKWVAARQALRRTHGEALDLTEVDPRFLVFYDSGQRIKVRRTYPGGATWIRTGTVELASGPRPHLYLKRQPNGANWDTLGANDQVIGLRGPRGNQYRKLAEEKLPTPLSGRAAGV